MPSRSRHALVAAIAVLFLALPAAALWMRLTVHFLATFNQTGSPGGQPPLAADSGAISTIGPGFSVTPVAGGGGALLVEGSGLPIDSQLTATFDTVFKGGNELVLTWKITPGQGSGSSSCTVGAVEENDSEIIDVTWGGGGFVDVGGQTLAAYSEGVEYDCKLTLKDVMIGLDTWTLAIDGSDGSEFTASGPLLLAKALVVEAIKITLPAGSAGSFVFDDIQAASSSMTFK